MVYYNMDTFHTMDMG
jgi:hypothetical protein